MSSANQAMVPAGQSRMFPAKVQQRSAAIEVGQSRAAAEVQAAMAIAKRFPRDEQGAMDRILQACQRPTLAKAAMYSYPRGDTPVTGPSIRLAEAIAQAWGNLDFGIVELSQGEGISEMQAYCWDLESNTRQVKVFQVRHERRSKTRTTQLTDPRDIYEMTANQGARRLRACILGIVPGDVVDLAVQACEHTMAKAANSEPIADRIKAMMIDFAPLGVTSAMIERRLRHKLAAITETEMVQLHKIFCTLSDGMGAVSDFFEQPIQTVPAPETEPPYRAPEVPQQSQPDPEGPGDWAE